MGSIVFRMISRAVAVCWLLALAPSACSKNTFDGQIYRTGDFAFRVGPIPTTWRRIDADTSLLAFRDDARAATIAVNGRCGKDGDDVPLQALTHHLFLEFTDRQVLSQNIIKVDGRDALRTELIAELDGVPKHFDVYVLKKDGCVYDFVYITTASATADAHADFTRFVAGFSTLSNT